MQDYRIILESLDQDVGRSISFKHRLLVEESDEKASKNLSEVSIVVEKPPVNFIYTEKRGCVVTHADFSNFRELMEQNGFKYWEPAKAFYFPGTKNVPVSIEVWDKVQAIVEILMSLGIKWQLEEETEKLYYQTFYGS